VVSAAAGRVGTAKAFRKIPESSYCAPGPNSEKLFEVVMVILQCHEGLATEDGVERRGEVQVAHRRLDVRLAHPLLQRTMSATAVLCVPNLWLSREPQCLDPGELLGGEVAAGSTERSRKSTS